MKRRPILSNAFANAFLAGYVCLSFTLSLNASAELLCRDVPGASQINVRVYETIPAQGFFGSETPQADGNIVRSAIKKLIFLSQKEGTHAFDWPLICREAAQRKVATLWLGCSADTATESSGGAYAAHSRSDTVEVVNAVCVISTYGGKKDPEWEDLEKSPLNAQGVNLRGHGLLMKYGSTGPDRYDLIQNSAEREKLYLSALNNSVAQAHSAKVQKAQKYWSRTELRFAKGMASPCEVELPTEGKIEFDPLPKLGEMR